MTLLNEDALKADVKPMKNNSCAMHETSGIRPGTAIKAVKFGLLIVVLAWKEH